MTTCGQPSGPPRWTAYDTQICHWDVKLKFHEHVRPIKLITRVVVTIMHDCCYFVYTIVSIIIYQ